MSANVVYSSGINADWDDVSPEEQVEYLHDLRGRWEGLFSGEKIKKSHFPIFNYAYSLPRAILKKEIEIRIHHNFSTVHRQSIVLDKNWAFTIGSRLPYGIHLLESSLNTVFTWEDTELKDNLIFDTFDIKTTLLIAQETVADIKTLVMYSDLLNNIDALTQSLKNSNLDGELLAEVFRVKGSESDF